MKKFKIMKFVKKPKKSAIAQTLFMTGIVTSAMAMPVLADGSGVGSIDSGLKNLKTLGLGIVSGIGVIVLIKGIVAFSSAFQQRDSSGMSNAGLEIGGGLILAAVGPVLALLGIA